VLPTSLAALHSIRIAAPACHRSLQGSSIVVHCGPGRLINYHAREHQNNSDGRDVLEVLVAAAISENDLSIVVSLSLLAKSSRRSQRQSCSPCDWESLRCAFGLPLPLGVVVPRGGRVQNRADRSELSQIHTDVHPYSVPRPQIHLPLVSRGTQLPHRTKDRLLPAVVPAAPFDA
jgi:hypothetical protein